MQPGLGKPSIEWEYHLAEDVIDTEFNIRPLLERRDAELGGDVAVFGRIRSHLEGCAFDRGEHPEESSFPVNEPARGSEYGYVAL